MPGYIIHLAEANLIISEAEKKYPLDNKWKNKFLIGSLLPDTKITGHKKESHFWNEDEIHLLAKKPDIDIFLKKYGSKLENPIVLGYFAHLILDVQFISSYWKNEFVFMDSENKEEEIFDKVKKVYVRNFDYTIDINKFLSADYYYGDYSRTNTYYIDKYKIVLPEYKEYDNPVEETDIKDMKAVFENIKKYCMEGSISDAQKVNVFSLERLDSLIENCAAEFAGKYI